jgi:hypothetical protein
LHKWEQLCPCSTLFDYKMPKLLLVDSPPIPYLALVHWMQVAVCKLMYILNSRPDLIHAVHQVACFVHNPDPAHVKALYHILRYLAERGTSYWHHDPEYTNESACNKEFAIMMPTIMNIKAHCKSSSGSRKEKIIVMMKIHPKCTPRTNRNKSKTLDPKYPPRIKRNKSKTLDRNTAGLSPTHSSSLRRSTFKCSLQFPYTRETI